MRTLLALAAALLPSVALASGAGFTIAADRNLGKPTEDEIPAYTLKLDVGQTVSLSSQGVVLPRGGAAQPSEADAAAWLFDDAVLQLVPPEKKNTDKTKTTISLKGLKAGKTRVRFVGNILGYEKKYDVLVEVVEAKK